MKNIFFLLIFFFLTTSTTYAALRINEVYPAPPSGEQEWVELYNDENTTFDLSSYTLTDETGKPLTISDSTIGPFGYIIAISTNVLNNSSPGDTVTLKTTGDQQVDIVSYTQTMTADKTYTRCPDGSGSWYILTKTTKQVSNEEACLSLTLTPTPLPTPAPISTTANPESSSNTQASGIYLSEVMARPSTGEKEWIELYNSTNQLVLLENWYIDDLKDAGSSPKTFTLSLPALGYGVVEFSNALFNNTGDTVRLIDGTNTERDSFTYKNSNEQRTLSRTAFPSGSFCETEPSRGSTNSNCIIESSTPTTSPSILGIHAPQEALITTDTYAVTTAEDSQLIIYQDHLTPYIASVSLYDEPVEPPPDNPVIQQQPVTYASVSSLASSVFFFSSLNLAYSTIKLYRKLKAESQN